MKYMYNSITHYCPIEMSDKHIICIKVSIQLFVSCLISWVNRINTRRYASRSYNFYTTDTTWYKLLFQHNVYVSRY